jgi:outer membrane protein assembly factor BamB
MSKNNKNQQQGMYFKYLLFALLLLATACVPKSTTPQVLPEVHLPINNSDVKFLWSRYYPFASALVEEPDHIIGLRFTTITSFDSLSGKIKWEITGDYPTELINSSSVLYETTNNALKAFDAQSGNLIWERYLKIGNALSLFADSEHIFVQHQTGNPIVILDKSRNVVRSLDVSMTIHPLSIDGNKLFFIDVNGLNTFDIDKNRLDWSVNVESVSQSMSSESVFYLDSATPASIDTILAIDKSTRGVIWTWGKFADINIISNLCILDEEIYFLTADGFLIGLNKINGQEVAKLEFSNKPFVLYRSEEPQVGEYHIAADPKNRILAIAFGDSFQLMAIQLIEP